MTSDPLIVTHSLKLGSGDGVSAKSVLAGEDGIVSVSARGQILDITYDLRLQSLAMIEATLSVAGFAAAAGLFQSLKRGWIKFTDDNLLSSVTTPAKPCCNQPPGEH